MIYNIVKEQYLMGLHIIDYGLYVKVGSLDLRIGIDIEK